MVLRRVCNTIKYVTELDNYDVIKVEDLVCREKYSILYICWGGGAISGQVVIRNFANFTSAYMLQSTADQSSNWSYFLLWKIRDCRGQAMQYARLAIHVSVVTTDMLILSAKTCNTWSSLVLSIDCSSSYINIQAVCRTIEQVYYTGLSHLGHLSIYSNVNT
jgi:hypothetical protein